MELKEEQKNFENYIAKKKIEIEDDILIKKNKE